jgi:transposase
MSISRKVKPEADFARRSSFHCLFKPNLNKISLYLSLHDEVRSYHQKVFNHQFDLLNFDGSDKSQKMLKYANLPIQTNLTGSFKNQICSQVADELSGLIRNFNYWFKRSLSNNSERTLKKLESAKTKPEFDNFELRFCFADLQINDDLSYLQLNGCGEFGIKHKSYGKMKNGVTMTRNKEVLRLPFKFPKYYKSLLNQGWSISTSVTLCKDGFRINYEKEIEPSKSEIKIGCDQGIKNCLSLASSDGLVFQSKEVDVHGHSLSSIQSKLCRKKKGSHNYRKGQEHRKNFINARINEAIKFIKRAGTLNLEDVRFLGKGRNSGAFLSKFEHSRIRRKLGQICGEEGLSLNLSASAYRSRRCNQCGWVDEASRKGKIFKCTVCGHLDDADLNAARNHVISLPKLRPHFGDKFLWNELGANLVPSA